MAFIFMGQQVLASALIIPVALRYLDRRGIGLVPWSKLRTILSFSGKLQVNGVVGAGRHRSRLPSDRGSALGSRPRHLLARSQLRQPAFIRGLECPGARQRAPRATFTGATGRKRTFREFKRLQRMWVVAVTGWTMVAMAAAYFGIMAWLGPRFHLAGWICIILIAGAAMPLVTGLIGSYITAIGKAGAFARYGLVSMVVNVALTVPMVLLGSLGVVTATAIGQLVAAVYMLHDVRRSVRSDLPNPLRYVPLLRGAAAAALTLGLEVVIQPYLPVGAVGVAGRRGAGFDRAGGVRRARPGASEGAPDPGQAALCAIRVAPLG